MSETKMATVSAWQNVESKVKIQYLLQTGHLADCSFIIYDRDTTIIFPCHKLFLSCASPVFERMFYGEFKESKSGDKITIDDTSADDFEKFRDYMYWNDNSKLNSYSLETLKKLIILADKYMVSSLMQGCIDNITNKLLTMDYCGLIMMLDYTHFYNNSKLFEQTCVQIKQRSFKNRFISAIYNLRPDTFYEYIKILKGTVPEYDRFEMIETYAKLNTLAEDPRLISIHPLNTELTEDLVKDGAAAADTKNNSEKNEAQQDDTESKIDLNTGDTCKNLDPESKSIKDFLNLISFYEINSRDFCTGPVNSKLLSEKRKLEILKHICLK